MNEMNHDDGLSSAARSALAALRAEDDLPADARARMWARLAAAQASAPEVEVKAARRGWTTGVVVGLALAASVALALVSLGRGAQEVAVVPRADAAIYGNGSAMPQPVRAAQPPVVTPGVATVIVAPEPALQASQVAAPMRERREPVDRKQPVPSDTSTLAAETALLQRAQTALAAGDPGAALARIDEHRESFADGVLARERDALRVTALCDAGRREDSRAAAAAFVRRHPASMLTERVQGTCVTP